MDPLRGPSAKEFSAQKKKQFVIHSMQIHIETHIHGGSSKKKWKFTFKSTSIFFTESWKFPSQKNKKKHQLDVVVVVIIAGRMPPSPPRSRSGSRLSPPWRRGKRPRAARGGCALTSPSLDYPSPRVTLTGSGAAPTRCRRRIRRSDASPSPDPLPLRIAISGSRHSCHQTLCHGCGTPPLLPSPPPLPSSPNWGEVRERGEERELETWDLQANNHSRK